MFVCGLGIFSVKEEFLNYTIAVQWESIEKSAISVLWIWRFFNHNNSSLLILILISYFL